MLSNFFTSLRTRTRTGVHKDPSRNWLTLLTLALFAFVCIVVWNIWAFDTVARGGVIGTNVGNSTTVFNRSSINEVRAIFEKRSAEEARYVTGVYRFADPSQ